LPKLPKPTRADLLASYGKPTTDVIAPNLTLLFCGINPGLYSGYTGHNFARPGNRFWPTLYRAGYTDRLLAPADKQTLLSFGYGITNLVNRATARADELTADELATGGERLLRTVESYHPRAVAVLGISAYRSAFGQPRAVMGRQPQRLGSAILWVLPNPSGLNAHYQLEELAAIFRECRLEVEAEGENPTANP
jgi:double-stranded uracil-DNA glycosylase